MSDIVTAAMIVIGDEILSGRTKDRNIGHLADMMTAVGIDLKEVRVVADEEPAIVEAVNALRTKYDHVFTTGGIGPTHDDITADSVAAAFGLDCGFDPDAYALLEKTYAARGLEYTEARMRMARMPKGAVHIANPVSVAPGFSVENVHVMAGVPSIFQAMLDNLLPRLKTGQKLISESIICDYGEGTVGDALGLIQKEHADTVIGSYPKYDGNRFWTELVVRARTREKLDPAVAAVRGMLADLDARKKGA